MSFVATDNRKGGEMAGRTLGELLGGEGKVLMLRYLKRVAAHLRNVCSAEVNPFHRIGYRG